MYDEDSIVLEGFNNVVEEVTFLFLGGGIAIRPYLMEQKDTNYPLVVKQQENSIIINDLDLVDIFKYLKLPHIIEFLNYENGYIADIEQ